MEDIWVDQTTGPGPQWLTDVNVHKSIQAMLKSDQSLEEHQRLRLEADNLCQWFGHQLAAVMPVLKISASKSIP